MFCIPLHYRGHAGEYRFSALSDPKCSKTCTPPRPRPSTPNPAYCFSEEATSVGFLPTIQRQHMICIPLHCRGRAGEYRFSALSGPKCSKTFTPPRHRASMNRGTGRNREPNRTGTEPLRTAIRFIPVQANPTEPNRTGTLLLLAIARSETFPAARAVRPAMYLSGRSFHRLRSASPRYKPVPMFEADVRSAARPAPAP